MVTVLSICPIAALLLVHRPSLIFSCCILDIAEKYEYAKCTGSVNKMSVPTSSIRFNVQRRTSTAKHRYSENKSFVKLRHEHKIALESWTLVSAAKAQMAMILDGMAKKRKK